MTHAESLNKLTNAVNAVNAAMLDETTSAKQLEKLMSEVKEDTKECNKLWKNEQYATLRNLENPMMHALKVAQYSEHKVKLNKDTNKYEIEDAVRRINLIDFDSFCNGCAADVTWKGKLANFARLLTAFCAKELGLSEKEVSEILVNYKLIKGTTRTEKPTLLSNRNMVSELQAVIDLIYFEDNGSGKNTVKVINHDVVFMTMAFTKQARTIGTIKAGTPANMADIALQLLHKHLMNSTYSIEYKAE